MDTHIAFILPGHSLVETTKSLAAMNREYPLYCSDEDDAVKIAKTLKKEYKNHNKFRLNMSNPPKL